MKLLKRFYLLILKFRLKNYRYYEKWYVDRNDLYNYYTEYGIPETIKEIEKIKGEIKK